MIFSCIMFFFFYSPMAISQSLFDGQQLGKWEITNFGTQGEVFVRDNAIVLGVGDGLTGITWNDTFPDDNYLISLRAKKLNGSDFFCGLTFPVQDSHCTFIVGGWGGALVGLSSIDGMDASQNQYKLYRNFKPGQWYKITVKVQDGVIYTMIDEEKLITVDSSEHEISTRADIALSTPLGIAAWNTKSALTDIELTLIK